MDYEANPELTFDNPTDSFSIETLDVDYLHVATVCDDPEYDTDYSGATVEIVTLNESGMTVTEIFTIDVNYYQIASVLDTPEYDFSFVGVIVYTRTLYPDETAVLIILDSPIRPITLYSRLDPEPIIFYTRTNDNPIIMHSVSGLQVEHNEEASMAETYDRDTTQKQPTISTDIDDIEFEKI